MICDLLSGERGRRKDRRSIRRIGRSIDQEHHHPHSLIFPSVTFDWLNPSPRSDESNQNLCILQLLENIQYKRNVFAATVWSMVATENCWVTLKLYARACAEMEKATKKIL